jgi:hypothetical protein
MVTICGLASGLLAGMAEEETGPPKKAARVVEGCLAKRSSITHLGFEPFMQPPRERVDWQKEMSA